MIRVLGVDGGQSGTRLRDSDGREAAAEGVSRLEGDTVRALADAVTAAWRLRRIRSGGPGRARAHDRAGRRRRRRPPVRPRLGRDRSVRGVARRRCRHVPCGRAVAWLGRQRRRRHGRRVPRAAPGRRCADHGRARLPARRRGRGVLDRPPALAAVLRAREGRDPTATRLPGGTRAGSRAPVRAARRDSGAPPHDRTPGRRDRRLRAGRVRGIRRGRPRRRRASSTTRRQSSCCSLPPRLAGPGPIKRRCRSRSAAGC